MREHEDSSRRRRSAPAFARYARLVSATLGSSPALVPAIAPDEANAQQDDEGTTPVDQMAGEATTLATAVLMAAGGLRVIRRRSGSVHAAAGVGVRMGGGAPSSGVAPQIDRRG